MNRLGWVWEVDAPQPMSVGCGGGVREGKGSRVTSRFPDGEAEGMVMPFTETGKWVGGEETDHFMGWGLRGR